METEPDLTPEEVASHDAQVDALLDAQLGDDDPEQFDAPELSMPEALTGDDAGNSTTTSYSEDDYHTAWQALRRDGWTPEAINAMDREVLVAQGLGRAERQRDVDAAFTERAELRKQLGLDSTEASEGLAGTDDPEQGFGYPAATGADLASLARPVAEMIAELDDPQEIAQALGGFVQQAIQQQTQAATMMSSLESRARELTDGYEGDVNALMQEAYSLGQAGRHSNLQGMERFDALVKDALALSGHSQFTSSNRATTKSGARPPMMGNRVASKPTSEAERLDARLQAIMNGERDMGKLRSI